MQTLWSDGLDPFTRMALTPASASAPASASRVKHPAHSYAPPPPALLHNLTTPPASPMHLDPCDSPAPPPPVQQQNPPAKLLENPCLAAHVARLLSPPALTFPIVALALLLVSRLRQLNSREPLRAGAEGHVLSTAFLVSLKALDDWRIDSSAWVPYVGGGMTLKTMNAMEMEFLRKIRWHVHVDADEYAFFVMFLRGDVYGADAAYPLLAPPCILRPSAKVSATATAAPTSAVASAVTKRRSVVSSGSTTDVVSAAAKQQQRQQQHLRQKQQQQRNSAYLHAKRNDQRAFAAFSSHLPATVLNPVKLSSPPSRYRMV
ncbi:hypothetical protein HDU84_004050 [Entophlyctis sp. JEL0112]|nr:hypothetical protein HDU84_004050 [Entophlyctis sp. JEL0112]